MYRVLLERKGAIPVCRSFEERWPSGKLNRISEMQGEVQLAADVFVPRVVVERYFGHPGSDGGAGDSPPESLERTTLVKARLLSEAEASRETFDESQLGMPPGVQVIRTAPDGTRTLLRVTGDGRATPVEVLGRADARAAAFGAGSAPASRSHPWKLVLRVTAMVLALVGIVIVGYRARRGPVQKRTT